MFLSVTIAVYGREAGRADLRGASASPVQVPYAKSKIQAEEVVQQWCSMYNINYLILRLPLVVGKQPPGNLGAISVAIRNGG